MNAPPISRDLMEYLHKVFQDKLPEIYQNPEVMGQLIGQQQVIRHLQIAYNYQNRTVIQAN